MTWWCSAQGTPWTWEWQAYPGVWVLVLLLAGGYAAAQRRARRDAGRRESRARPVAFAFGLAALWIAADWPVGPLGAGYLLSVHTLQYMLFTFVVPPLLITGMPASILRMPLRWTPTAHLLTWGSRPLIAFVLFNTTLVATHLPVVVDGLTATQLGSFAVDMAWLGAGVIFWWPVLGRLPELRPLGYPGRIVYLIANIFLPTIPASFMTFADYPIYALYELAPPVGSLSATADQQLAGLLMKVVGGLVILATGSVLFFKWFAAEEAGTP